MTATPQIDQPIRNTNIKVNHFSQGTQSYGPLSTASVLIDFSSGWTFAVQRLPNNNPNPNAASVAETNLVPVGLAAGLINMTWSSGSFALQEVSQYTYDLIGSTDSFTTSVLLGTGSFTIGTL